VRRPPWRGGRLEVERPKASKLKRWQVLGSRNPAFHAPGLPAPRRTETRAVLATALLSAIGRLILLLILGVININ
jgi:hypothetical protein